MHRRKDRVALVEPEGRSTWVNRPEDMADIEELMIGELARRHVKFVEESSDGKRLRALWTVSCCNSKTLSKNVVP
jgi:tRNA1(Val) A37 N6-methylase TrmN6